RDTRRLLGADSRDPGRRPPAPGPDARLVARHRTAHAEGLDRPEDGGWRAGRGDVSGASGPPGKRAAEPGPPGDAGELDAKLPARGAVRRLGPPRAGARRAPADGRPPHERQSTRQRREAPRRPRSAGLHPALAPRAAPRAQADRYDTPTAFPPTRQLPTYRPRPK